MLASLNFCVGLTLVAASTYQESLQSQPHQEKANVDAVQAGRLTALSEAGYRAVARFRSDEAMKEYMRRILKIFGRRVDDEGALSGFVPHYSGVIAVQNYEKLKGELLASPWSAPLGARKRADALTGMTFTSFDFLESNDSHVSLRSVAAEPSAHEATALPNVLSALQHRSSTAKEYNSVVRDDIDKLKKETRALLKSTELLQGSNSKVFNILGMGPDADYAAKFLLGTMEVKNSLRSPDFPRPSLVSLLERARAVTKQSKSSDHPLRPVSWLVRSILAEERAVLEGKRKEMLDLSDDLQSEKADERLADGISAKTRV